MALSPETLAALDEALQAVVAECGDDPKYTQLVGHLQAAGEEIADAKGGDEDAPAERDGDEDDFSFETAERRLKDRRAGRKNEDEGEDA